jgi:hypothetical protein
MGLFNLGGVLGAFMPDKTSTMVKNQALQDQINSSTSGMNDYRSAANEALSDYGAANRAAMAKAAPLYNQSIGEAQDLKNSLANSSYMADRERVRAGDLSALQGLLGSMGGGMSASDKIAASRLGYAGRPSSTYMDKARQSYLGAFASPIAANIFGGLNNAAYGSSADRYQNIGTQLGLMNYRNSMPSALAGMTLNPLYARQQARQSEIGQLQGLSDASNSNFAGFKTQKNKWAAAAGAVDDSLNSAADMAMSAYSGGLMGGGGGGMLGKVGGMFGLSNKGGGLLTKQQAAARAAQDDIEPGG